MSTEFYHWLEQEYSKNIANQIVNVILEDPHRIEELMACFFHKEKRINQRASWPVGMLAEKNQDILIPYLPQMISNLDEPLHDAVVRNTIRAFQFMRIPEEYQSEIFERCLDYLSDPKYPIAFAAFAMTVCTEIAVCYPELKDEVINAIEYRMPEGSAGIRARGNKELQRLRKLIIS